MLGDPGDRAVALIYEAALDAARWPDAVTAISHALGCLQGTLEFHDRDAGVKDIVAPLCDPAFQRPYAEYYGKLFSLGWHTHRFPVGRLYEAGDCGIDAAFRRGEFYNEWWRPQGTGGASLLSNLVRDGQATASLTVYKPHGVDAFTTAERDAFASLVDHMIRAVSIQRRLQLDALAVTAAAAPHARDGFVLVDRDCRVLVAAPATAARLHAAGLLADAAGRARVRSDTRALERLVAAAAGDGACATGGDLALVGADGRRLAISVMPCRPADPPAPFAIDRPAALLCLADPAAQRQALAARLVARHGLTPAEAAVAIEIGRGDGRQAAAQRLGIRETTVRAHLTAIFDKLDVRRQAELTRFLSRA